MTIQQKQRKRYLVNTKTKEILGYFLMPDNHIVGLDPYYMMVNSRFIESGFKTLEEAEKVLNEYS